MQKHIHQLNIAAYLYIYIYLKFEDIMIRVAENSHAKGKVDGPSTRHGGPWRFRANTGDTRTSHLDLDRLCRGLGHHVTWPEGRFRSRGWCHFDPNRVGWMWVLDGFLKIILRFAVICMQGPYLDFVICTCWFYDDLRLFTTSIHLCCRLLL